MPKTNIFGRNYTVHVIVETVNRRRQHQILKKSSALSGCEKTRAAANLMYDVALTGAETTVKVAEMVSSD